MATRPRLLLDFTGKDSPTQALRHVGSKPVAPGDRIDGFGQQQMLSNNGCRVGTGKADSAK